VHRYIQAFEGNGDADNNLVIFDYDAPTEVTADNFLGHFVYGLDARHVETVICQGKVIVEDRRVTTVDEGQVLAYAREMGQKLWDKM
jgi:cytosine/adenosine deaminase-related metal-dependent hydrolase